MPYLRALGNIVDLRSVIDATGADTVYNQTGEWLQREHTPVWTSYDLMAEFNVDLNDGTTVNVLDICSANSNFVGWAVYRSDDANFDFVWAVPRFLWRSDMPLREPSSFFMDQNGDKEDLRGKHIDLASIPSRMHDLYCYDYIFKPDDDEP